MLLVPSGPALALALATLVPAPGTPSAPRDDPFWTPIVVHDEVRVEMDTTRVAGRGPYAAWLRWRFLDRASSPGAWDAGVRESIDLVEVDCARGATRTLSTTALTGDGSVNEALSADAPAAGWRTARAGTVGAEVTQRVCEVAAGAAAARAPSPSDSGNLPY